MVREGLMHPTFFELATACGFLYFAGEKADIAVIETGLGGRTDATNVLNPLVSVITTIGVDHANALGGTVELIAREKAGIIKPGIPCVLSGGNGTEATGVIREAAACASSRLVLGSDYKTGIVSDGLDGQKFNLAGEGVHLEGLEIKLLGSHQAENAKTAVLAAIELKKKGYRISDEDIRMGLKRARWPGRMELLRREPPVLIDGAHNPQAAEALAAGVRKYLEGRPVCLVMGAMADKDAEHIVGNLSGFASKAIATLPPAEARLRRSPSELALMFEKCGVSAEAVPDWREALEKALESGMAVVVAGSLYLAGAARTPLMERLRQSLSAGTSVGVAAGDP